MRFMILRKADKNTEAGTPPSAALMAAMGKYNEQLVKAGVLLAGEGLRPSAQGTRVRLAGKKLTVTDGPFAEAKELIGGYSIIEVKSKEEALAWIARWPAEDGDGQVELELRRLYELSDFPVDPAEKAEGWRADEQRFREATERPGAPTAAPARQPGTTRFIVMLRSDQTSESGKMPGDKTLAEMGALMSELAQSGALLGGEGLKPSAQGARIKFARGKHTVTDGPFAETKEMIAGFSLIQVRSKEQAIDFARRWLQVHAGVGVDECEIEIRPLYEPSDFAA
jgi:hypothetical protein